VPMLSSLWARTMPVWVADAISMDLDRSMKVAIV
jgi:hypothetical protein